MSRCGTWQRAGGWLAALTLAGCPRPAPPVPAGPEPSPPLPASPAAPPGLDPSPSQAPSPAPSGPLPPLPTAPPEPADADLREARQRSRDGAPLAQVEAPYMRALKAARDDAGRDAVLLEFLRLLERRGAYSRLAKLTQQVLQGSRPTLPVAQLRYLQGVAWAGLGQDEGAYQAWHQVEALAPGALGSAAAAEAALLGGELERAAELARRAIELDPGLLEARSLHARARVRADPEQARDELEALAARHPDDLSARFQLAAVAGRLDDHEAEARHLEAVIRLGEAAPLPLAQLRRARALWLLKRYDQAATALEAYLEAHPDDLEALVWRAGCWQGAGQLERAQAQWRLLARERGPELRAFLHAGGRQLEVESLKPWVQAALD